MNIHVKQSPCWEIATLIWFDHTSGIGFVARDGKPDVLITAQRLRDGNIDDLERGDLVAVKAAPDYKGYVAVEVRYPI